MGKTEDDYDYYWGGSNPWAPTEEDSRGDYEHDVYRQQELDDEWASDSE